jgi:hypothetical protein
MEPKTVILALETGIRLASLANKAIQQGRDVTDEELASAFDRAAEADARWAKVREAVLQKNQTTED